MAYLKLKFEGPDTSTGKLAYALKVTVTEAQGIAPEIFMFQVKVPAVTNPTMPDSEFIGIADPVSLQNVPVGVADPAADMPYFREPTVSLEFANTTDLDLVVALMKDQIAKLVDAANVLEDDDFVTMEEVEYGERE